MAQTENATTTYTQHAEGTEIDREKERKSGRTNKMARPENATTSYTQHSEKRIV